jgi:hypothetical protein
MRKVLPLAAVALVLLLTPVSLRAGQYGWSISASSTDPAVNQGTFQSGVLSLYLWYACSDDGGMAAAEFRLDSLDPANALISFETMNGFLNAGTFPDVLLAVGGCPVAPRVAGRLDVSSMVPGDYCVVPSGFSARRLVVDCNILGFPLQAKGYSSRGTTPLCYEPLCPIVSVEQMSWGRIKGIYR